MADHRGASQRIRFLYGPTDNVEGDNHIRKKHDTYEDCKSIADWLISKTKHRPKIGIVCGSGLGGLAEMIEEGDTFRYSDIPGFPVSTVAGHAGSLSIGRLKGKIVLAMKGRFHTYEGYPPWKCSMPIRVMKLMGIETVIITNAAGGLNPNYKVGDIMIIKDHINWPAFSGHGSLIGPNDDRFGPRFPGVSDAYDKELIKLAHNTAKELGMGDFIQEGVYSMQSGPCFETVAECRLFRMCGADATGMSTVPETCAARHCGMRVLGMSLITNECVQSYEDNRIANHEEVLATGKQRSKDVQLLVTTVLEKLTKYGGVPNDTAESEVPQN